MLSRWIVPALCCLLPLFGWCNEPPKKDDLVSIEQKILTLKKRLENERLKEMDEEIKSQDYMIADWEAYRKEIEKVRHRDEIERQLEMEIQQLELEKARLLQKSK